MLKEKAGETAGKIWSALNETEGLTAKQIKKATNQVGRQRFVLGPWLVVERRQDLYSGSRRRTVCYVGLRERLTFIL